MSKFNRKFNKSCSRFAFWDALSKYFDGFVTLLKPDDTLMLRPDDRSTLKDIHTLLYQCCKAAKSRRRLHLNELHKLQNIKKEIEAYASRATNKA